MNKYLYQSDANIACLLDDEEYSERREALFKLVKSFEQEKIKWGLGCSANLFLRGIVDEFHDFDLIVDGDDVDKVKKILEGMGAECVATGGNGYCESEKYFHYQLGRVDVDVISGFKVCTFGGQYLYRWNVREIEYCSIYEESKVAIPLIATEALYALYFMMEGWQAKRRYKRMLIEEYLREYLEFPEIFQKALEQNIPTSLKCKLRGILHE